MEQVVTEIHRPARKNFPRRKTVIKHYDDLWQSDLADFQAYKKFNSNNKYMLFVIDAYSKFLWVKPLKDKTAKSVTAAFKEILIKSKRKPNNLQTDDGKEFYNQLFSKLMKEYSINHYSTYSSVKASIVERVIRTIKNKLYKQFSLNGSYKWTNIIQEIVDNYNNTKHSTILLKPKQVTKKTKLNAFNELKKQFKINTKYKVGAYVRISKHRNIFDKGYHPNFTTEIFKINEIKYTKPITYLLKDMNDRPIKGAFYEFELTDVKYPDIYLVEKILRRKANKVYVKFLGIPDKSWVNKSDLYSKTLKM